MRINSDITIKKMHKVHYIKIIGKQKDRERSRIHMTEDTDNIHIRITAEDIPAMRASINSSMRDIQTIESSIGKTRPKRKAKQ